MSISGTIIGYDPGGNRHHGVAKLSVNDGRVVSLALFTRATVEQVILDVGEAENLVGLGVDTLTCWSTGQTGWRQADLWLRERYPAVRNSIVPPNSLRAMVLNGMAVLISVRNTIPEVFITETHPKVLLWYLRRLRHDYKRRSRAMDALLAQLLAIAVEPGNEDEWDAALSAFAALQSLTGQWTRDLHHLQTPGGERLVMPCGRTCYYWPE